MILLQLCGEQGKLRSRTTGLLPVGLRRLQVTPRRGALMQRMVGDRAMRESSKTGIRKNTYVDEIALYSYKHAPCCRGTAVL